MHLDEYMSLDATALAELVSRKQVTPTELLALARQRADEVNPRLNAIVRRLDDVADRQAADPNLSGPFAGVPFLLKDLGQEYRGFATSCGCRCIGPMPDFRWVCSSSENWAQTAICCSSPLNSKRRAPGPTGIPHPRRRISLSSTVLRRRPGVFGPALAAPQAGEAPGDVAEATAPVLRSLDAA